MQPVEKPDTYLALSVWGLIMFWPTAIAAIINSVRVSSLWNAGRYEEAVGASQAAYRWGKKSITLGIVIMAVITIMYLLEFAFLF